VALSSSLWLLSSFLGDDDSGREQATVQGKKASPPHCSVTDEFDITSLKLKTIEFKCPVEVEHRKW